MARKYQYRWNDIKAIKRSLGGILNSYIAGEIEGEKLRNIVYAANCLINACKQITDEELSEIKTALKELEEEANGK